MEIKGGSEYYTDHLCKCTCIMIVWLWISRKICAKKKDGKVVCVNIGSKNDCEDDGVDS